MPPPPPLTKAIKKSHNDKDMDDEVYGHLVFFTKEQLDLTVYINSH